MYLGSLYVNSFNEFGRHWQVTVQAEGDYRNRVEDINLLQVRNKWGQMVPLGTLVQRARDRRPGHRHALQPLHGRADHRQPGARDQLRATTIEAINRLADETLPLSMKTEWTELMFMQIRAAANTAHVRLRAVGRQRLPGPGGLVRELGAAAGGDPGGADVPALLAWPACCARAGTSTSSCRSAWWCWSAWRARTPS